MGMLTGRGVRRCEAGPMTKQKPLAVMDARGRSVRQLDPVVLHLLRQHDVIPAEPLKEIANEILPGASRQGLRQILIALGGLVLVGIGYFVYFRYVSTWRGLDAVQIIFCIVQFVVIASGPLIAYRVVRRTHARRVVPVMLAHGYCPHCGYNISHLPADPLDGATVCPECGCAWQLGERSGARRLIASRLPPPATITMRRRLLLLTLVGFVAFALALWLYIAKKI